MEIEEFIERISKYIPFEFGLEGDKLGIQVRSNRNNIKRVLITYEIIPEVVEEARNLDVELIVTFHPLIYHPLSKILYNDRIGFLLFELIKNSISVVVCHTNFDAYKGGTSWIFAEKLGLKNIEFLVKSEKNPNFGFGIIGNLESPISDEELLMKVQSITFSPLRWCRGKTNSVRKVALVGGSGINFAQAAYENDVDVFITADVKYHNFHQFIGRMMIVDPGHWEMEYLVPQGLKNLFENIFKNEIRFFVSNIYTNPISYFVEGNFNEKQKRYLLNKLG